MGKRIKCDECSEEFTVTTKSHEPMSYCVFCGEEFAIPTDDDDDDDVLDDEDDD